MSKHPYNRCPVCTGRAWFEPEDRNRFQIIHCMRCGQFRSNHYFRIQFRNIDLSHEQVANVCGFIRENPSTTFTAEMIPYLKNLATPLVSEKAMKLLAHLRTAQPRPGRTVDLQFIRQLDGQMDIMNNVVGNAFPADPASEEAAEAGLRFLGAAWAEDQAELLYLVEMLKSGGLIEATANPFLCQIARKGWELLQAVPASTGMICFIAMWFDESLKEVWLGPISEGIRNAGYHPYRVDTKEFNDDVTDEILAGIRTSKFVLADFTGHRAGVYYEAGFAAGLGKQVIRCIRHDQVDDLHFDTRQLNHIVWRHDAHTAFSKALTARIVATVGQGPASLPDPAE